MTDLQTKAQSAIERFNMIKKGDTVIAACSGGADSVALFHFLYVNKDIFGITLRAVHVNHRLRGADADADAEFVKALCDEFSVPLDTFVLTPPEVPSENWARGERYKVFEALSRKYNAKIATAHTQNDLAETVLFNIARGSGVHGAAGIPAVRGVYIRPLIETTREEVEQYIKASSLKFVTDATNFTDDYARNRIRLSVLPEFEKIHGGAVQAIARFAENMGEAAAYLDKEAQKLLDAARLKTEKNAYDVKVLNAADGVIRRLALRLLITPHADATRPRIALADKCAQNGGAVQISQGIIIFSSQGILRLQASKPQKISYTAPFALGKIAIKDGPTFMVETQSYEKFINFQKHTAKPLKFYADYDRITDNTCFRTRKAGDTFCMAGRGVTKKLKDIFSEAKLSLEARDKTPLLARGSEVLWVSGLGFAQSVLVSDKTRAVLTIKQIAEE